MPATIPGPRRARTEGAGVALGKVRAMTAAGTTSMRSERVYAIYLVAQAVCGVLLWVAFALLTGVRSWFELMPANHEVMDAFVFADLLVVVIGSSVSAWAIDTGRTWAVPVIAFTAGAIVYPTLYLIGWVSFAHSGSACLAVMVPTSTLTCWVAYQTWKASR